MHGQHDATAVRRYCWGQGQLLQGQQQLGKWHVAASQHLVVAATNGMKCPPCGSVQTAKEAFMEFGFKLRVESFQ